MSSMLSVLMVSYPLVSSGSVCVTEGCVFPALLGGSPHVLLAPRLPHIPVLPVVFFEALCRPGEGQGEE